MSENHYWRPGEKPGLSGGLLRLLAMCVAISVGGGILLVWAFH